MTSPLLFGVQDRRDARRQRKDLLHTVTDLTSKTLVTTGVKPNQKARSRFTLHIATTNHKHQTK